MWFAGLLVTGVALVAIAGSGAPRGRRLTYVTALTVAATLVLLRLPSVWASSVALATVSWALAVLLWQAWPRARRRDRRVGRRPGGADQPPVAVHS